MSENKNNFRTAPYDDEEIQRLILRRTNRSMARYEVSSNDSNANMDDVERLRGQLQGAQGLAEQTLAPVMLGNTAMVNFLRDMEVFSNLGPRSLSRLSSQLSEEFHPAGSLIIRKGDEGDRMYILYEGEVQIPIIDKDTQQEMIVYLGPRQIFGEMALLTGEPRFNDVIAKTDCKVLVMKKQAVEELMSQFPEIASFLTTILGRRLMKQGMQSVGKYKLVGQLGKGAMAIVYEGLHPALQRVVAIKMLSHELIYRSNFREKFRDEARILARLRHPNIVEIFDKEEAYATFFIIMEKLTGQDLNQMLKERGRFTYAETRNILKQLAAALDYAHQNGIIHRDIKPANVILNNDGVVKLTDFGIALEPTMEQEEGQEDNSSKIQGTPNYMAPEQVLGNPLDNRVDIYAMGIVAFKMLTGRTPFRGPLTRVLFHHVRTPVPTLLQFDPNAPQDLEEFIQKATQKDPKDRFQSGQEILEFFGEDTQSGYTMNDLEAATVTVVYPKAQREQVQTALEKLKEELGSLQDVLLQ